MKKTIFLIIILCLPLVCFGVEYEITGTDSKGNKVNGKVDIDQWRGTIDVSRQSYYVEEQEHFCLMWENPHSDRVIVTFDCEISDK